MTTPLFLLRCVQLGLSMGDLDFLTIGLVNDMFTEKENDERSNTNRKNYAVGFFDIAFRVC